jgi:uncharacterized protein (TIGR02996 family)
MFPADEHPFLDVILARPLDDGPRLVYADYLDETGHPLDAARADLVRVQVALARLPADHPRNPDLRERERDLLQAHRRAWTAPLATLGAEFTFRRGIPDAVALDAATFLRRGEELFDNTQAGGRSFVRQVLLREPARVAPQLADCPILAGVEELSLCQGGLGNGGVELLVRSPFLGAVRSLDLGFNGLGDAGVRALARASTLPSLQFLALNDNGPITGDGAAEIADSPFLAGLLELDLSGNEVPGDGVRALVTGRATGRLHALKLAGNPIGDGGLAALVGADVFHRAVARDPHLDLRFCELGPDALGGLAASPELARVEGLDLRENYVGDAGALALCDSGRLGNVRTLRLARNQVGDAGAVALAAAEMPRLRVLDVSGNRLTRRGTEALRAAAQARGFALDAAGNGTETAPPLLVSDREAVMRAAREDVAALSAMKRRVSHPSRPNG